MRGKALSKALIFCAVGITPACAGKSSHDLLLLSLVEDHPRVCGEKLGYRPAGSR